MRGDIDKYLKLKEQIKALNDELKVLGQKIMTDSGVKEGQRVDYAGHVISYLPTRRYSLKPNRSKGLAGFIKRTVGEEMLWKLAKFDYKDMRILSTNKVDEFFDCKTSFSLRVREGEVRNETRTE